MTVNEYLEELLDDEKLQDKDKEEIQNKRDEVERLLNEEYGNKIKTIKYSGSIAKKTAINTSKDLDLAVHFKNNAFSTLKDMYENVHDFLDDHYNIRKQKVSIGLTDHDVDVVPGRRIDEEDENNNDVNLYNSDAHTRIKTNIEKHKQHITESECRKIIKLFKIWKNSHSLKFKSFAVELLVIQALDGTSAKSSKEKVKEVLEYIENKIESVKLIDPANSQNNVSDAIKSIDKTMLKIKSSTCLGHLKSADEGKESLYSAWKKVFNDFSGDPDDSANKSQKRFTSDYGSQPNRRHGSKYVV